MPPGIKPEPGNSTPRAFTPISSPAEENRAIQQGHAWFGNPPKLGDTSFAVTSFGSADAPFGGSGSGSCSGLSPFSMIPKEAEKAEQSGRCFQDHIPNFGTKFVTIRVGREPEQADFAVHENLLKRSPFFVTALNSLQEAVHVLISEHNPQAFNVYVQWLYSGRLYTKALAREALGDRQGLHRHEWHQLTGAYLLGNCLEDNDFQDSVIDAILAWFHEAPSDDRPVLLENINYIYEALHLNNPLRHLVSDIAAWHFTDTTIQNLRSQSTSELPCEFVLDTLMKLSCRFQGVEKFPLSRGSPVMRGRGSCSYHCHGDNECYKKR